MNNYLNDLYVMNENNDKIYKASHIETFNNGETSVNICLTLVCGKEYPNEERYPEASNGVHWCSNDYFIEEVQEDTLRFDMFNESIKERLEDAEYTIINSLPSKIYKSYLDS